MNSFIVVDFIIVTQEKVSSSLRYLRLFYVLTQSLLVRADTLTKSLKASGSTMPLTESCLRFSLTRLFGNAFLTRRLRDVSDLGAPALLYLQDFCNKPIFRNVLQQMGKYVRKPLPDPREQRSFFPLFPSNLVGLRKVPGKHLFHFHGKLVAQDNRIHLVIA